MLSESHSDADNDDDTEAPDDNTQHQNDDDTLTTSVRQRPYQLTQPLTSARCVSWHRVIHASRWCRAVIDASVSRVPTKCTTKDAAVLFAARLSTCCCVCTNLTSAWTWCLKITLRGTVTKNNIRHLNIMFITVLDHECHI